MPQPIMKKYKHGEMGAAYPKSANEKLDGSIMKKYKHGEFSDAGGKARKKNLKLGQKKKLSTVHLTVRTNGKSTASRYSCFR